MLYDILRLLGGWTSVDSWIAATGALAAMACALPGCFLVVRKQSMMGDALSHAALPGIVLAFLTAHALRGAGWFSDATYESWRHAILFAGAVVLGVVCAVGTEFVQKLGRVESSAALGVVFTTLFAIGLLLLRLKADQVDIDPDCVLYGTLENVILDRVPPWGIPRAAITNGLVFLLDGIVIVLLFKEFRISAFDPSLATALGIHAGAMHYLLMVMTAVTLVAAFESVGSILVIAMLIVPPATAYLLTDRLSRMLLWSLVLAAGNAVLGHAMAITLPPVVFGRWGFPEVRDASTAGMMAAASGLVFVLVMILGPRYGLLTRWLTHHLLARRVAREDVVAWLYRVEERAAADAAPPSRDALAASLLRKPAHVLWTLLELRWKGWIRADKGGWRLTASGKQEGQRIVRSHRLWESFLARHFPIDERRLHGSAERAEHFIDERIRAELADELQSPRQDPHGARIPDETSLPE